MRFAVFIIAPEHVVHTFSPRIDTMPGLCRFLAVSTALALLASPALAQDLAQAPSGPSAPEAVSVPPLSAPRTIDTPTPVPALLRSRRTR